MASITVKNGTAVGAESLCLRCMHGHRQKGFRESEELLFCTYIWEAPRRVPFKVAECTSYSERNTLSMYQMQQMALLINPASTAKSAGFTRSDEQKVAAVVSGSETIK
ncbi:MAG TPA: hypothetical protein VGL89_16050 [Candidatus Koribacter sp.]|jgi:hypothetical protein